MSMPWARLLYAALTGRPPFQAATALETMQQVLEREPVALRQLNAAIPRDLETIVLKCLEKSVPRRYATAQALADDLRRYLEGRPILARPVGRWEHAWRWCRRQPVVAGLSAGLIFALLVGTTVSVYFAVKERQRANESDANAGRAEKNAREAKEFAAKLQLSEAQAKANAKTATDARARGKKRAAGQGKPESSRGMPGNWLRPSPARPPHALMPCCPMHSSQRKIKLLGRANPGCRLRTST